MISQMLGRYRIQAEIARGAMGKVYRGYDPLCRRVVAMTFASTASIQVPRARRCGPTPTPTKIP